MSALPYFQANEASWSGPFTLRLTDPAQLRAERGLLDALSWRLLSWLPCLRMDTSVTVRSPTEVHHTTRLRWGPLTLMAGEEDLVLDGASLSMGGESRTILGQRDALSATGTVDEASVCATYTLRWLGMDLRQTGERTLTGVTLRQWGPGFESEAVLIRV